MTIKSLKWKFAQGRPGQFFSDYNVSPLKEYVMNKLLYFVSFKWVKELRKAYKIKQDRKRTAYQEKRWEMKLRGLR